MKKLIIGYGVSGKAAARFLEKKGETVVAVDRSREGALLDSADFSLEGFDQVILSPGIPYKHPLVQKALDKDLEVIGEIELGMRFLKNRAFGVTGTNGKTTAVLLMEHILKASGIKAKALGNVGESLTDYLLDPDDEEILLIELSSYQLETIQTPRMEACFILNIFPNHLDRYPSFKAYVEAKALIQNCLISGGNLFISKQVKREFGNLFPNANVLEKPVDILKSGCYTELMMPSSRTIEAAYLLCKRCGVSDIGFLEHLKTFKKPAHRIEWVAKINDVAYYNDSKSSNVQSVIHAVEKLDGPLILIVGGTHKGASYKPWIEEFKDKVRMVIAYGKAAPIIECELKHHFPMHIVDRFEDAICRAKVEAKIHETVLLSPGCSSFDQFDNYKHRGEEFKRLVREE